MTEETLFIEALEIRDPVGRARFLDWACSGDGALRARVERLLDQHERAGDFLAHPAAALDTGPLSGLGHGPAAADDPGKGRPRRRGGL